MSFFEFQIDVAKFLTAQRNYLRQLALCPPVLPSVDGIQVVVDRIDIGPSSLRHDEEADFPVFLEDHGLVVPTTRPATGRKTKLAQEIVLQLTTDASIRANPNGPPADLVPLSVTLVYELSAFTLELMAEPPHPPKTDCYLNARMDKVELGPLPPLPPPFPSALPPQVTAAVEAFLTAQARLFAPSGTVRMGLDQAGLGGRFLNAGVAVDTTGSTLAIRVQVGGSYWGLDIPWTNFYSGAFLDRRQGRDWALFVEAGYITESIETMIGREVPPDDDLEAFPGCSYRVENGQAVLDISALLIYHVLEIDAVDIDLTAQADPHVLVRPRVETPNQLTVEIDFSHLVQVRGFLTTLGLSLAHLLGLPVEEFLIRMAGAATVQALEEDADKVEQTSPTTVRIDQHLPLPSVPGVLRTAVTDLLALPDGISLAGSLAVTELTSAVPSISLSEFRLAAPDVSCGPASIVLVAAFRDDPSRFAILHASASVLNEGTAPLRLCEPPIVLRPEGPVKPGSIRVDANQPPIDLWLDIGPPDAAYAAAPYPIDILVRTNGGTRLMRFAPLPIPEGGDYEDLAAELLVKIGDCQQLVDPWFTTHSGLNPLWGPRPPEVGAVEHLWEVVISGLPAGQGVQLQDAQGVVLASALSSGAPVRLMTLTAPVEEGHELTVARIAAEGSEESGQEESQRGLQIRQTNLLMEASVPTQGTVRRIVAATLFRGPAVVALLDDGVTAFDVSSASPPAALGTWPGRFSGMARTDDGILLYGEEGIATVDASGRLTRAPISEPVVDATRAPHGVAAVTRGRVLLLSHELQPRGELDIPDATSVVQVRGGLVIGSREGLELVIGDDLSEHTRLVDGEVTSLRAASVVQPGALLAGFADSSSRLLLPGKDDAQEIASYDAQPWFTDTVRIADRIVRVAATGNRLEVLRLGTSVVS